MKKLLSIFAVLALCVGAVNAQSIRDGGISGIGPLVGTQSGFATANNWAACTPTVTLVGGIGNTVPVYLTNHCRYTIIGKTAIVEVNLNGDGGAEGAGTGVITVNLPVAVSANTVIQILPCGRMNNNTDRFLIGCTLQPSVATVAFVNWTAINALGTPDGNAQNNAARLIAFKIFYEID
jgi:hypothetical protein